MFLERIPPRAGPKAEFGDSNPAMAGPRTGPKMGSVSERELPQPLPQVDISSE
jgi:hypothetical protein